MHDLDEVIRTDVLIIGGGIAGLSLATALGREGFDVTVIDGAGRPAHAPPGSDLSDWDLRVSALTPASMAFLDAIGARTEALFHRAAPYQAMRVWDANGSGRIAFHADDIDAPCLGQIVENREILQALLQSAQTLPSVSFYWEHALETMSPAESGWLVTCANDAQFRAALVIGADGARSKARQLLGMPTREWSYAQTAIVATVGLAAEHADTCWQVFLESGPLAMLPLADPNKVAIVWSLDDAAHLEMADLTDAAFVDALNRAMGSSGPVSEAVGPRASFPLSQRHALDYCDESFALVADAAHSFHPLAGQGINLGLTDVAVLTEELVASRAGGLALSSAVPLRRYQRRRKTENLAMMAAMEGFKRGFGTLNPLAVISRNLGLSMVDQQGWLKRWFMRHAIS
jgi:2-octaprenylphenol hydroxylase